MTAAGDSKEQRKAEEQLVNALSEKLEVSLTKKKWKLGKGSWIEVDGFCDSPLILCEAWAHIGNPKSAQKHKVMTDAFKLLFIDNLLYGDGKRILLFADKKAATHFQGKSWMAQCLKKHNIIVEIIELPTEIKTDVKKAQKRQYR
ncbi:MAG: hypothetical protein Q8O41_07730 [Candidatus Methanoperedens sp.]|nr:hypothetical protein [Candidatus Methanoperedens sp.]